MDGVEPGEYSVTVGDTVKSDRKGKETFQVFSVQGLHCLRPPRFPEFVIFCARMLCEAI